METNQTAKLEDLQSVRMMSNALAGLKGNVVHRAARLCLAITFWLHALFVTRLIPQYSIPDWSFAGLNERDILLLAVIVFYSLLGAYGWFSLIIDILWIYLSPVIFAVKWGWKVAKGITFIFRKHFLGHEVSWQRAEAKEESSVHSSLQNDDIQKKPSTNRWLRCFYQFATLWGLLIIFTSSREVIFIGTVICLIAAARSGIQFSKSLSGSLAWIDNFQANTGRELSKLRDVIASSHANSTSEDLRKSILSLKGFKRVLDIACDKKLMTRWIIALSLFLSVPYYVYISLLCSFGYFGIARFFNIVWTWHEALVDALFMPFAWTDLPHNSAIRILGGIQGSALLYFGFTAVFSKINEKVAGLSSALEKIRDDFEDESIKTKLVVIEQTIDLQKTSTVEKNVSVLITEGNAVKPNN